LGVSPDINRILVVSAEEFGLGKDGVQVVTASLSHAPSSRDRRDIDEYLKNNRNVSPCFVLLFTLNLH